MKMLLWHVKHLSYKDRRHSNRPKEISSIIQNKSESSFNNSLLTFLCIEEGDVKDYVDVAAEEIIKLVNIIRSKKSVVIIPFAHLSSKLAKPTIALKLITDLVNKLQMKGFDAVSTTFGYHKDFQISFKGFGHPASVVFRSIPK